MYVRCAVTAICLWLVVTLNGSSGSDDRNNGPIFTTIDHCGTPPTIANGDFLLDVNSNMYVTYQCNLYYRLQGNSRVMCYRNDAWTTPPECIVDYCELDTTRYVHLEDAGVVFIKSGNQVTLGCHSSDWRTARAHCTDRHLKVTECQPRDIQSFQRVLGFPRDLFPVGHALNTCLGSHPRGTNKQMPDPPQLTLLNVEEQRLYFELQLLKSENHVHLISPHLSRFTLGCKPSQCTLKILS